MRTAREPDTRASPLDDVPLERAADSTKLFVWAEFQVPPQSPEHHGTLQSSWVPQVGRIREWVGTRCVACCMHLHVILHDASRACA